MRSTIVKLCACLVLLYVGYLSFSYIKDSYSTKQLVASKPLVQGLATEVRVIPVVVAKKSSVKSRLRVDLPAGHSVTATADLLPSETGYGVLSVIDENTGVSTLQQYEKPRTPFGFPCTGRVKAGLGMHSTAGRVLEGSLEFTPLRVGAVYVTAELRVDLPEQAKPSAAALVFLEGRF